MEPYVSLDVRLAKLTPANEVTLERTIQLIKGGFTDHQIRDDEDLARHRDYIPQNPVKRRLVTSATEYCSAFREFKPDKQTSAAEADAA